MFVRTRMMLAAESRSLPVHDPLNVEIVPGDGGGSADGVSWSVCRAPEGGRAQDGEAFAKQMNLRHLTLTL